MNKDFPNLETDKEVQAELEEWLDNQWTVKPEEINKENGDG